METVVLNLIGGSGIGKSTTSAGLFYELKKAQIDAELVVEFAKQLVWQERHKTFDDQLYVFAKQHNKIFSVNGKVEVIVTDCPLLISGIFSKDEDERKLIVKKFNQYNNINIFLKRTHKFNPNGRLEDENGARENDRKLEQFLKENNVPYFSIEPSDDGLQEILEIIMKTMGIDYKKKKRVDFELEEFEELKKFLSSSDLDNPILRQIVEKLNNK